MSENTIDVSIPQLPQKIEGFDWPDEHLVRDGYALDCEPALSQANFKLLAKRFNELVDYVASISQAETDK